MPSQNKEVFKRLFCEHILALEDGFTFVASNQPLLHDGRRYIADLILFDRRSSRIIIVNIKVGNVRDEDTNRLLACVASYKEQEQNTRAESPIGVLIQGHSDGAQIVHAIADNDSANVFERMGEALPSKEELRKLMSDSAANYARELDTHE